MKIFIVSSRHLFDNVAAVKKQLEWAGHEITLPNSYDDPGREDEIKKSSVTEHATWKASMLKLQAQKVAVNDAILVLNFEKNGLKNYIGGATFLEIYEAFKLGKKIFLFNPIPEGMLHDELLAMAPMVIHGDLSLINKEH